VSTAARTSGRVELEFPADARYLVLARLSLAGLALPAGLDEEALADLKLAVTEACSNVVRHAYGDGVDGDVRLRLDVSPNRLTVEVTDGGVGFDSADVGGWQAAALRDRGMGLSIIESVTDALDVAPCPNGVGTRVTFSKLLPE